MTEHYPDLKNFNDAIVDEFRSNGGQVGGQFAGAALLLLTTIGAKSGKQRLSPLVYLNLDDKMIIVGSYAGAPVNPAWVHNVRATPRAFIEVGTDAYDVSVRELVSDERDALWERIVAQAPFFGDYQAKTSRVIPLFELTRS